MSCVAVLDLCIAVPHSHDDLTPVGLISYDRKKSIPATPIAPRFVFATARARVTTSMLTRRIVSSREGRMFPSAVRGPEQASRVASPVAVRT
eukprot:5554471-Pyramimonas_sp.AAC.1